MSYAARRLVWVLFLVGCDHSTPFSSASYVSTGPLRTGTPTQLTYNPGVDERVAWLPTGGGFLYTEERADLPQHERCLAEMPAAGGTVMGSVCASLAASQDSQITFESAAVSASGQLTFVRAGTVDVGFTGFGANALLLTTLGSTGTTRLLLRTPLLGPNARAVDNFSQIQWMGDTTLIALGEREVFPTCRGCPPDTVRSGLEIDRINIGADSARVVGVPGTDSASSVAVGAGDTIYFTINGQSLVFRQALSVGARALLHDFGPGVVVRDVRVAGSRFAVITGGQVTQFYPDSTYTSTLQRDHGGDLRLVDLAEGTEAVLTMQSAFARRPVISPDGHQVVFERYPYVINEIRDSGGRLIAIDTVVSKVPDLWSVSWP